MDTTVPKDWIHEAVSSFGKPPKGWENSWDGLVRSIENIDGGEVSVQDDFFETAVYTENIGPIRIVVVGCIDYGSRKYSYDLVAVDRSRSVLLSKDMEKPRRHPFVLADFTFSGWHADMPALIVRRLIELL